VSDKPKAQQDLNIEQIAEQGFGGDLAMAIGHAAISVDIGMTEQLSAPSSVKPIRTKPFKQR